MLLLALGAVLIFLGFLMLIWPRREQKDCAHDEQNRNHGRENQDHELWNLRPERRETKEESKESNEIEKPRVKGGAVVMIGPIPIVIGSDPRMALFMMIIASAMMILWMLIIKGN